MLSGKMKGQLKRLFNLYPAINNNLPLSIGCNKDCNLPVSGRRVAWLFASHCRKRKYLQSVIEDGSMRHDLYGNPISEVTEKEREYARSKLAEVREHWRKVDSEPKPRKGPAPKPKPEKVKFALPEKKQKAAPKIIIKKKRRIIKP